MLLRPCLPIRQSPIWSLLQRGTKAWGQVVAECQTDLELLWEGQSFYAKGFALEAEHHLLCEFCEWWLRSLHMHTACSACASYFLAPDSGLLLHSQAVSS